MEEKKLDVNSIIGFVLIFGILIYMFYINQPTAEELAEMQQQEQVEKEQSPLKEQTDAATTDYDVWSISNQMNLSKSTDVTIGYTRKGIEGAGNAVRSYGLGITHKF